MFQIYSWLHSTFKEISNDTSHAQIRVRTKKLWPRQFGQSFMPHSRKLCRDIENYVVTWFSVATEQTMLQHRKLCCNIKTISR